MRHFFSIVLAFFIFIQGMVTATAHHGSAYSFPDLSESDPYYPSIIELLSRGIIKGNEDGTLGTEAPLLRADISAMLVRAKKIQVLAEDKNCFPDVRTEWFAGPVCALVRLGFLSGYPDGYFRPARIVTAGEAAKMKINTLTEFQFKDLQEALDFLESRGLSIMKLTRDESIPRKEAFGRMVKILVAPLSQQDSEGNPFDPETDTIMVVEPDGPPFYVDFNQVQYERHLGKDPIVLFFYANWCPLCRHSDEMIHATLESLKGGVVIFKVDYDNETALKKEYGITYQDTFVVLNKEGEDLQHISGLHTPEAVQELIDIALERE